MEQIQDQKNFQNVVHQQNKKLQQIKLENVQFLEKFHSNPAKSYQKLQYISNRPKNCMESISNVKKDEMQENFRARRQEIVCSQNSVDLNEITQDQETSRVLMSKGKHKRMKFSKKLLIVVFAGMILLGITLCTPIREDIVDTLNTFIDDNATHQIYDLVKLNSTEALCLDGTPGSYYISRNGDPSKILLYFQGGGWSCGQDEESTLRQCYDRSKTGIGSSKDLSPTMTSVKGILAHENQDYFKDWKKVMIHYCDGAGHQGYRKDPIEYNGTKLYFRGHNITIGKFEDLQKRIGLFTKATHVVLTGGSAGGLAAYTWTNYLASRIQKGKLYSAPDAGLFYDGVNKKTGKNSYKMCLANLMQFSNAEVDLPVPECLKEFPTAKENCMFAQNLWQHIKVSLFPVQSVYDSWSIPNILGLDCIQKGISSCSQQDRDIIEQNRRNVTDVLRRIGKDPKNGVWGLGCVRHGMLDNPEYLYRKAAVPEYSAYTSGNAVAEWLQNPEKDNVHIDYEPWPANKPCS